MQAVACVKGSVRGGGGAAWVRAPGLRASTRVCAGGLHGRVPGGVRVQAGRERACVPVRRCGPPLCHSEAG